RMGVPDRTSSTGIVVVLPMISVNMLSWLGSRCWISTNAIPVSDGSAWKKSLYASRPPAEAPMATTGKETLRAGARFCLGCFLGGDAGLEGRDFIFALSHAGRNRRHLTSIGQRN